MCRSAASPARRHLPIAVEASGIVCSAVSFRGPDPRSIAAIAGELCRPLPEITELDVHNLLRP